MRKKLVVVAVVLGLFVTGTGVAQAWDMIHDKSGHGRVTLRAWTRNYNQVAYVAEHAGTRVWVTIRVRCESGYSFDKRWSDGGDRFRFILRHLGNDGQCNHTFKVEAKKSGPELDLTLWARG
ncbi:MAG TPA: hypothetical protein VE669_10750 [Actinomycetota bacterium]|nr:hypothetical protein [Actinomycetota bacterium]